MTSAFFGNFGPTPPSVTKCQDRSTIFPHVNKGYQFLEKSNIYFNKKILCQQIQHFVRPLTLVSKSQVWFGLDHYPLVILKSFRTTPLTLIIWFLIYTPSLSNVFNCQIFRFFNHSSLSFALSYFRYCTCTVT